MTAVHKFVGFHGSHRCLYFVPVSVSHGALVLFPSMFGVSDACRWQPLCLTRALSKDKDMSQSCASSFTSRCCEHPTGTKDAYFHGAADRELLECCHGSETGSPGPKPQVNDKASGPPKASGLLRPATPSWIEHV